MKKILVMCPSRSANGKRIPNFINLYKSWKNTTTGNSDFLLGIDEIIIDINPEQFMVVKKLNYLSKKYIHKYEYVHFIGDDCLFTDLGWEDIYLESAKDKKYVMFYGNDLIQGEKLPTHPFISTNIIKKLGFMGPDCLQHMFVDNFWKSVGLYLKCLQYFPMITVQHNHPARGFETDEIYKKNKSCFVQDNISYNQYMRHKFIEDMKVFNKE